MRQKGHTPVEYIITFATYFSAIADFSTGRLACCHGDAAFQLVDVLEALGAQELARGARARAALVGDEDRLLLETGDLAHARFELLERHVARAAGVPPRNPSRRARRARARCPGS